MVERGSAGDRSAQLGVAQLGLARVVAVGDGATEGACLRIHVGEELTSLLALVDLVGDDESRRHAEGEPHDALHVTHSAPGWAYPVRRTHTTGQSRAFTAASARRRGTGPRRTATPFSASSAQRAA